MHVRRHILNQMTGLWTHGYRRITGLLHGEGWTVNHRGYLKVPQKQPEARPIVARRIRRRPEYWHLWAYDFVDRAEDPTV